MTSKVIAGIIIVALATCGSAAAWASGGTGMTDVRSRMHYSGRANPHGRHPAASCGQCCGRFPRGWGWYLRQRLRHDCAAPLSITDERSGVTWAR
jgi:hypothetical protein